MERLNENIEKFEEEPKTIGEIFNLILSIISTYMDLPEDDKKIIALWCIASAFKDNFITFPYLYINASKGSGKTRLLKLLESIIPKAKLTPNLTEASLIRAPSQKGLNALLIDEAERLTAKEKSNLRELLNQAYKKGGYILRVEKNPSGKFDVKEYPVYLAIALANIWGLESVLQDRCITIILEKSGDPNITKIPEFFDLDERIQKVRHAFDLVQVVYVGTLFRYSVEYIFYNILEYTTYTTHTLSQPTLPTLDIEIELREKMKIDPTEFFGLIQKSELKGRDLELWLPLLVVSSFIGDDFFVEILKLAEERCKKKRESEIIEDRDTIFSTFLYYYVKANNLEDSMIPLRLLRKRFMEIEGEKTWLTSEWISRCLRRLKVIKDKRRMARGVEVMINMEALKKYLDVRGIEIKEEMIEDYKVAQEEVQTDFSKW